MATIKEKSSKKQQGHVMHVYKLDTGAVGMTMPESPVVVTKKMVSSWGLLRRSKTYRENEHQMKLGENVENVKNVVVSEGRKSVAIMEATRKSAMVTINEGRKSVSSVNEGRKSVSSNVEGINVGAVAAFMGVKVLVSDMPGFMQVHAFRRARETYDGLDKFSSRHMACDIKKVHH